ncbi:conserved hypothetical protein [Echinococcus multilocularis]|uniref:Uncharacterized protein n=1 Tax=Echinococcus multilocularis TaxID=6211 RepID=A0A068YA40_ECHMU|nr:conserved hypothetical protein [Echinococcus multilocularis]
MHGGPNSPSHRTDNGDVDSQHSYKSSDLFRRSVDSAESGSPSNVRRRNRSFRARSHADTESNNSDGFSALEKRSQSSSRCSENNNSITKRPIWQYWGRAQIPDLLDPPSHEPYIPMQVFGPAALVNSQPGNEWPAAHFAVNSPTVPKSTDISVTRNQPNTSEDGGFGSFLHKSPFRNDRLAGVSRRDLYRRNLLKNCKETKTNSALDLNRHHSITKSVRSQ